MSKVLETREIFGNLEGKIVLREKEIYSASEEKIVKKSVPKNLDIHLTNFYENSENYNFLIIKDLEEAKALRDYLNYSIKLISEIKKY